MLPVFQEYPFLIALSVFTNVYLTIYHMIKIPVSQNISSYRPAYGNTQYTPVTLMMTLD
jgi:hypothetical protein